MNAKTRGPAISDAEASNITKELRLAAARVCEENIMRVYGHFARTEIGPVGADTVLREAARLLREIR